MEPHGPLAWQTTSSTSFEAGSRHCRSTAAGLPCEDTALAGKNWLFWASSDAGTKSRAHRGVCSLLTLPVPKKLWTSVFSVMFSVLYLCINVLSDVSVLGWLFSAKLA